MTIETEENIVLRGGPNRRTLMWCPACRRQVEMVTPEQAAQIAGASERAIYRWVETGKLHFTELPSFSLLICVEALAKVSELVSAHANVNLVLKRSRSWAG